MLLNTKIPVTYLVGLIVPEVFYTTAIWLVTHYFTDKYASVIPEVPLTIPAFLGTAISIILSFKLNQSYDRWWEARKVWGSIINDSRTLVLQLQSFVNPAKENDIRTIAFRQIAWCFCLGQSLRGLNAMDNMDKYLSSNDLEQIATHNNKPLAILQLNAQHIAGLKKEKTMDIFSLVQLNNTMVAFSNSMGMAERIKSTVFPTTYRLFLHWVIYLFAVTFSSALQDFQWYLEYPLLLAISLSFFILDKTARQLQDPFNNKPTDTAMTTIATNIEINIKQLLNEDEIPEPLAPHKFYSL